MNNHRELVEEYESARGIKDLRINRSIDFYDFNYFLEDRAEARNKYRDILKSNGIFLDDKTIEVGKGLNDSAALGYNTDITIVTPYDTTNKSINNKVITGKFMIQDDILPVVEHPNKTKELLTWVRNIMTENPYSIDSINDWYKLNNMEYKIIIGMYGNVNDKDANKKLLKLDDLAHRMKGKPIIDGDCHGKHYAYVLRSNANKYNERNRY
jgi:hypothetical protein